MQKDRDYVTRANGLSMCIRLAATMDVTDYETWWHFTEFSGMEFRACIDSFFSCVDIIFNLCANLAAVIRNTLSSVGTDNCCFLVEKSI